MDFTTPTDLVITCAKPGCGAVTARSIPGLSPGIVSGRVSHASFGHWWEPLTFGVGPAGEYVRSLSPEHRDALRSHCQRLLPAVPVEITATAWAATSPI